jgi:hypothetical protein
MGLMKGLKEVSISLGTLLSNIQICVIQPITLNIANN